MQILNFTPVHEDRGRHQCVAILNVQYDNHLRLYGLRLLRMEDGQWRIFAPQSGPRRVASFTTETARQLTDMAVAALGEAQ